MYNTNVALSTSAAVANGIAWVGCGAGYVICFNASNGNVKWANLVGDTYSSPAYSNGLVYVGSEDHNMYCLNASTGSPVWNYTTKNAILSSPAVAYGMVYFGSEDYNVYCLNTLTGALVWNYTTLLPVGSFPAISNDMVYIAGEDENIYCFSAISGTLIHTYSTNSQASSASPTIAYGEVFYVSNNDENLTCYPFYNGPPSSPLNFQAIPGENQVNLTWAPSSDNGGSLITDYKIYSGTSPENETFLLEVSNVTNFILFETGNPTTYYFTISAINKYGESPQSTEISTIITIPTTNSTNNSTSTNGKLKIGGMSIGAISLVSSIGVIFAVISVKKRLK